MNRNPFTASISILIFLVISFMQLGCDKSADTVNPGSQDYITFGYIWGECVGDCRDLFLLTSDGVFRDAGKVVDLDKTEFDATPMSNAAFVEASRLWEIPESLIKNQVNETDLKQIIADVDFYISGEVANSHFQIIYDSIDSNSNRKLYEYSLLVAEVITNIR